MWAFWGIIALISALCSQGLAKKYRIHKWKKKRHLYHHQAQFNRIFSQTNGYLISKKDRSNNDMISLTYGEIDFLSFIALLEQTHISTQSVFYDLGSGVGKAVIACAMVFNVKKSIGIEILPNLHEKAIQLNRT